MKSVLISIRPKWCELIASVKKTLEVRKTRPKLEPPFKVYIYCTADTVKHIVFDEYGDRQTELVPQRVIGEFICDCIFGIDTNYEIHDELPGSPVETWLEWNDAPDGYEAMEELDKASCLSYEEIKSYVGVKGGYGWHISDLKIYDKPKKLSEFLKPCICPEMPYCPTCPVGYEYISETEAEFYRVDGECATKWICRNYLKRPPQSWCYVEELQSMKTG